jgi:hypothetical protein
MVKEARETVETVQQQLLDTTAKNVAMKSMFAFWKRVRRRPSAKLRLFPRC